MFNPDLKKMLNNVNSRYSLVVGTAKEQEKSEMRQSKTTPFLTKRPFLPLLKKFGTASMLSKSLIQSSLNNESSCCNCCC